MNAVNIRERDESTVDDSEEITRFNRESEKMEKTRQQVNAIFVKGMEKETETGIAWKTKDDTKHKVGILLDTGNNTNLISERCCTRMGLKALFPPKGTIIGFGGKKIKILGWVKLQLQIGGVVRKIKCNSSPDLQDM